MRRRLVTLRMVAALMNGSILLGTVGFCSTPGGSSSVEHTTTSTCRIGKNANGWYAKVTHPDGTTEIQRAGHGSDQADLLRDWCRTQGYRIV